jgi:hypothetical protein
VVEDVVEGMVAARSKRDRREKFEVESLKIG